MHPSAFFCGAAQADLTPSDPLPLCGYPHVARVSTGVHDPLLASALFLGDGATDVLFVGCDVIFISKPLSMRARRRISESTGIPVENIVLSATHTHSGPRTSNGLKHETDPSLPRADAAFVAKLEEGIVEAATGAWRNRVPAEVGLAVAEVREIGTNRHDPAGPSDPRVPILLARAAQDSSPLALLLVAAMHPTVLHEDSTLVSGDFPGLARRFLQREVLGEGVPVVYHTGTAGNQSPRHVTRANTFEEAGRLGEVLGRAARDALPKIQFHSNPHLTSLFTEISLPPRNVPSVAEAERGLKAALEKLEGMRRAGAPRAEVRTAECDWFGAENALALAKAREKGLLQHAYDSFLPIGIHVIGIGPWTLVAWPGEVFVEFGLEVARHRPNTFVLTYANGEMQGYVTTREAVERSYYEAGTSMLANPEAGECMVRATLELLDRLPPA